MNMFMKYNLRALNYYRVENLQPVPETFRCPNSQKRDLIEIQTRARIKNYIINLMIGMIFTRCFGILVDQLIFSNLALTSRPTDLLVNLNKLLISVMVRVEIDHESRA